jgi:ParB family chromosome partitioning protein
VLVRLQGEGGGEIGNDAGAGAAYNPIARRLLTFSDDPVGKRIKAHERHAEQLLELDERVNEVIKRLKSRGFTSPYLRAFVVARINPLRWIQGEPPPLDEVLKTMRERAGKFNTDKVRQEDLAVAGGPPDED